MDETLDKTLDVDFEEIEYTEEEEMEVVQQLDFALLFQELSTITTKKQLKEWFANLQMHKRSNGRDEYCPNITGQDLIEIARKVGFKIIGGVK